MARIPDYDPQLAQLVKAAPSGPGWLHELKYDGYRIGCRIDRGRATLISRNGKDWTDAFPEIAKAAAALRVKSALVDGEVCLVLPDGRTSFQALQNLGRGDRQRLVYFAFDLLHLDGRDLMSEPLEARKRALERIVRGPRIRFSAHLDADGPDAWREACRLRLEGIVSKPRDQPYLAGRRAGWLKTKCIHQQEFVIGGFTDPEGSRQGIGALLVGHYDGSALIFAGKVGTGFTTKGARELRTALNAIETKDCPFAARPAGWLGKNAHWVRPRLVGEVVFTEWTDEGKVRHPSFQGLRRDKDPRSVVRERPAAPPAARPQPPEGTIVRGIRVSNPDRVMYPDLPPEGGSRTSRSPALTKLDIVRYYDRIADAMMPHVEGRPLTLVRCGAGIDGDCIYMKHSKLWAPRALTRVKIQEKTKIGDYLVVESPEALVSLAQMDILEIHTWNTRYGKVEHPDRIVLDLDPGPEIEWAAVVEAAKTVRRLLRTLDLESYVKTTGGRGLHLVVPLEPRQTWDVCLDFARAAAGALARHDPALFTTAFAKRGRERQILVDYMRNNRTNTSIAAFSTRARPGAPVSTPISWTELTPKLSPASFTVGTAPARVERLRADPWADYFKTRQRLSRPAIKALDRLLI
jgi:bifunctional non-homologous end joining protein LigD